MRRFLHRSAVRVVLVAMVVLSSSSMVAAETCGWLAVEELDRAFPDAAPWSTFVGGKAGSCKFTSDSSRPPNIFGATQMVKGTPAEAAAFAAELRKSMAETYDVESAPAIGEKGFFYLPRGDESRRSLFFVGHRGRVAVMGSMTFQKTITPAQRKSAEKLILKALAIDEDPAAIEAATTCPWFDRAKVRKLLPGKGYTEQVFGSNSCLANIGEKIVMLSIVESEGAREIAEQMGSLGGCKSEELDLAEAGWIQYACTSGNPRASVRWVRGSQAFEISFIPGREPTESERALLIDLARAAAER
jgi:hypothetical protein